MNFEQIRQVLEEHLNTINDNTAEIQALFDYLRELAASFHKFYALHRVVSDDPSLTQARLLLTHCVRLVLRNGLTVLGVSAPKKM